MNIKGNIHGLNCMDYGQICYKKVLITKMEIDWSKGGTVLCGVVPLLFNKQGCTGSLITASTAFGFTLTIRGEHGYCPITLSPFFLPQPLVGKKRPSSATVLCYEFQTISWERMKLGSKPRWKQTYLHVECAWKSASDRAETTGRRGWGKGEVLGVE